MEYDYQLDMWSLGCMFAGMVCRVNKHFLRVLANCCCMLIGPPSS
eukprot:SAG11_NODE_10530_length_824_cov_1.206897_2_plen_44_part_01